MKKVKKSLYLLAAALMCIFMCIPSVSAANVFDGASKVEGGKKYSFSLSSKKEQVCFKIDIAEKGDLVFKVNSDAEWTYVHVYDSEYSEIEFDEIDVTSGKYISYQGRVNYDSKTGTTVAKYTYPVKKGTYYIQFTNNGVSSSLNKYSHGKYSISILSPNGNSSEVKSDKSDASVKLTLSAGDKISLGAVSGGKSVASAKWSTSDEKIAKVNSKGQVTAIGAGTCMITWKSDSAKFNVYIEVTK